MTYKKDIFYFFILFTLSVIIAYYTPQEVRVIYQFVLLFLFYKSKKDFLYLALIFIIVSQPGGLFAGDYTYSIIKDSPVGNLFFEMVFVVIAAIKALKNKNLKNELFVKDLIIILMLYFAMLLVVFGVYKVPAMFRLTLPWLFLLIIPRLFNSIEDFARSFNIIFYFTFVVVAFQIINTITGRPFSGLLGDTGYLTIVSKLSGTEKLLRPTEGIPISFLALLGAMFFQNYKQQIFTRRFLNIIIAAVFFSIVLSATRGWILAALFIIVIYLLFIARKKISTLLGFATTVTIVIVSLSFTPVLQTQTDKALKRFETIILLAQGDVTAGGTLRRIDERGPRVMQKFEESPLIGSGFGQDAINFTDGHVGNQNLLMHTGIIGFGLFFMLLFSIAIKLYNRNKILSDQNLFKSVYMPLILFLLGLIIIHSTSAQVFGYLISMSGGFLLCFLFSFANFVYWESLKEEKRLKLEYRVNGKR